MQWWNDFLDWFTSTDARPVVLTAILVAVAIIVSGIISALIARGAVRGMLARGDRAQRVAAIAALVDASTEASVWNSLTPGEQVLSDRAVGQADIQIRMLPVRGAVTAADWASHQLAEMKRNSSTFGYQLEPAVAEFRDRLLGWQRKPHRAKRVFSEDLERWNFQGAGDERRLQAEQDAWVAKQHHEQYAPTATTATKPSGSERSGSEPTGSRPAESTIPASNATTSATDRVPTRRADTQTQRLMDDVDALDRRRPAEDVAPEPVTAGRKPTGLDG